MNKLILISRHRIFYFVFATWNNKYLSRNNLHIIMIITLFNQYCSNELKAIIKL